MYRAMQRKKNTKSTRGTNSIECSDQPYISNDSIEVAPFILVFYLSFLLHPHCIVLSPVDSHEKVDE